MSERKRAAAPGSNGRPKGVIAPQDPGINAGSDEVVAAAELGAAEQDMRAMLREHGLRYSRPREAILMYMGEEPRHVSAEALFHALRERGEDLSLSTVYLNLGVLAEVGLLREFKGAHGESLYDSTVEPHHHLICPETGEVVDVPTPMIEGMPLGAYLKAYVERVTGWKVEGAHLSLRGRPLRGRRSEPED